MGEEEEGVEGEEEEGGEGEEEEGVVVRKRMSMRKSRSVTVHEEGI